MNGDIHILSLVIDVYIRVTFPLKIKILVEIFNVANGDIHFLSSIIDMYTCIFQG